jgi:hypothetical protein
MAFTYILYLYRSDRFFYLSKKFTNISTIISRLEMCNCNPFKKLKGNYFKQITRSPIGGIIRKTTAVWNVKVMSSLTNLMIFIMGLISFYHFNVKSIPIYHILIGFLGTINLCTLFVNLQFMVLCLNNSAHFAILKNLAINKVNE